MNNIILLLCTMIFCHIVDDYYLQGWLASAKQREWWKQNAPQELYKNDYIVALICHSFSWSFMINLPLIIYTYTHANYYWSVGYLIINLIIHAIIDHAKANLKIINLIKDQMVHFIQIICTLTFWYLISQF